MSDHTVAIVSPHGAILREARKVQLRFAAADISDYEINIEIKGQADKDTVEVEYSVAKNYGAGKVTGNNLDACLDEFLRRQGWSEKNKVKSIAFQGEKDIPY